MNWEAAKGTKPSYITDFPALNSAVTPLLLTNKYLCKVDLSLSIAANPDAC